MSGFGGSYAAAFGAVSARQRDEMRAEAEAKEHALRERALATQEQEAKLRIEAAQSALEERRQVAEAGAAVQPRQINVIEELPGPNQQGPAGIAANAARFMVGNRIVDDQRQADALAAAENSPIAKLRRMYEKVGDPLRRQEGLQKLDSMHREGQLDMIQAIHAGLPKEQIEQRFRSLGYQMAPGSLQIEPITGTYNGKERKSHKVSWSDIDGKQRSIDDTYGTIMSLMPMKDQAAMAADESRADSNRITANAAAKNADTNAQEAADRRAYNQGMLDLHRQRERRLATDARDEKNPLGVKVKQIEALLRRKLTEDEVLPLVGIAKKSDGKPVPEEFGKLADEMTKEHQKSNPDAKADDLARFRTNMLTGLQRSAAATRSMAAIEDRLYEIRKTRPEELPAALAEARARGLSDDTLKSWGYEMTKPPVQGRQPSTVRAPDGLSPTAPASASRIAPTSQTPVYDSEQREMDAGTRRAFSPAALAEIEAVNQRRLQAATEASRRYRQKELERDLSRARGQVVR